jgi:hypothetical protein
LIEPLGRGPEETMSERHELTDEQCDRLMRVVTAAMAKKYAAGMPVECLNTDIAKHPALGRSLVRAAFMLGKTAVETQPNS